MRTGDIVWERKRHMLYNIATDTAKDCGSIAAAKRESRELSKNAGCIVVRIYKP